MKVEKNDGVNLVSDPFAMGKIRCRRGTHFPWIFCPIADNSPYDKMSGRTGISVLPFPGAYILKAIRPCAEESGYTTE